MPQLTLVNAGGEIIGPAEYVSAYGGRDPVALQEFVNRIIANQAARNLYGITFVMEADGQPGSELYIGKVYGEDAWEAVRWDLVADEWVRTTWSIPHTTAVNVELQVETGLTIPDEVMAFLLECDFAYFVPPSGAHGGTFFGPMRTIVDGSGTSYEIPYGFADMSAGNFWLHQSSASGPIVIDSSVTIPNPFPGYNDGLSVAVPTWGDAPDPELFWTNRVLCKEWF